MRFASRRRPIRASVHHAHRLVVLVRDPGTRTYLIRARVCPREATLLK